MVGNREDGRVGRRRRGDSVRIWSVFSFVLVLGASFSWKGVGVGGCLFEAKRDDRRREEQMREVEHESFSYALLAVFLFTRGSRVYWRGVACGG